MIERILSRSGHPILRQNGVLIASEYDPCKEAEGWVDSIEAQVRGRRGAFVFGVGCGYHLKALVKRNLIRRTVAVDSSAEFIQFASDNFSLDLIDVPLLHLTSIESLASSRAFKEVFQGSYSIIEHAPSLKASLSTYQELRQVLLGRTIADFDWHLSRRPDFQQLVDPIKYQNLKNNWSNSNRLVSIKNLLEIVNSEEKQERMMLLALGELVR